MALASVAERVRAIGHLDGAPLARRPTTARVGLAGVISLAASLGTDVALVHLGVWLSPTVRNFSHFRVSDYGTLTAIGVAGAIAVWPLVVSLSSTPQWLYRRLAMFVTMVLWLPDLWLVAHDQPIRAVSVLVVMHLGVALITYNAVVRVAPARPRQRAASAPTSPSRSHLMRSSPRGRARQGADVGVSRRCFTAMLSILLADFVAGVVALVAVPFSRPDGLVPSKGGVEFVVHASLGALLLLGGITLPFVVRRHGQSVRRAAVIGLVGVVIAAGGGLLEVAQGGRLVGMALMFVGFGLGCCGYIAPLIAREGL